MQEPRQLYGLGSLVKKITKPIKKIVKSPIGKAALAGAALYGLGGAKFLGGKGIFASGQGLSRFGNLANLIRAKQSGGLGLFDKMSGGQKAFLGAGALLSALPFFTGGDEEEEITADEGFDVTPTSIENIRQMARNRDPSLAFLPQEQFVRPGFYAAEGGTPREMFAKGSSKGGGIFSLANLIKLLNPLDPSKSNLRKTIETGSYVLPMLPFKEGGTPREMFAGGASKNRVAQLLQLLEGVKDPMDRKMIQDEIDMLLGKFAKGGIADLPKVRMLEGGMPEIDYRQSGGFVPVGKKEKADDVPAMLSKNEFVMTADAVRGMGDGSVEKGAQRMYDQMKQLESRVA